MALARLDHVIFSVPDIRTAHRRLVSRYPEAWPVGRFWPNGLTSGIAIGGFNLELIQPDTGIESPVGHTLVFEPASQEEASRALKSVGLLAVEFDKVEGNAELLRLRGFEQVDSPQLICRNLLPREADLLPFEFFLCEYVPSLKVRLSSDNSRLVGPPTVTRIQYETPDPSAATSLLDKLGYRGTPRIEFTSAQGRRIRRIETGDGPILEELGLA